MTKLVIVAGPTAVGKSAAAINLAKRFNGEVISADSMQIYKGMDIGTGKVTIEEAEGVPHHMLDVVMPNEEYSVGQYVLDAKKAIDDVVNRGKIPILCGGTGLYINSLLFGHSFAGAPKDEDIRDRLKTFAANEGADKLYAWLKKVDPVSAEQININDTKRIIRALEIYEITGKPRGAFKDVDQPLYDYIMFVITDERDVLYDRINRRVDNMVLSGLLDEVKGLYKYKEYNSMQAIGYKEIVSYLDGGITLDEAIEQIKQSSRRYAKRQMTFFRGMKTEKHFVVAGSDEIYEMTEKFLME
ncbi:MAG: tRNA (adenosine(37)-N6)-dimethylallyltransferase MiaA [Clostridiales bacterium]|nr:tRNA (adenosine(37)-N6)-dimethylallyltransferase MiaA [Clostridiales bacterium]